MTAITTRGQIQLSVWGSNFPVDALKLLEEEGYEIVNVGKEIPQQGHLLVWASDSLLFQQEAVQLGRRFATAHLIKEGSGSFPPDYRTFFRGEVLDLSPAALQDGVYERRRVGQMARFRDVFGEPAKMMQMRPYYGSWEDQYVQSVVAELMQNGPITVTETGEVERFGETVYGPYKLTIDVTMAQDQNFKQLGREAMFYLRLSRELHALMGVKVELKETEESRHFTSHGTMSLQSLPEGQATFEFSFVHGMPPPRARS